MIKAMEETARKCCVCKETKPIKEFKERTDTKRKQRRTDCRECINLRTKLKWRTIRKQIFDYYGWECVCCGEDMPQFMSIDHINNDGYKDKNPNGDKKSGKELYLLIIKQGFPDKYQTLCMNCNWGKKVSGICPHNENYGN